MSKRSRKKVANSSRRADQKSIDNWTKRNEQLFKMSNAIIKVSK